jgi:hypothetical protein
MVAEGDAETDRGNGCEEDRELKPIKSKTPQIKRDGREREDDGADQERAGLPVHTLERNAKSHLKLSLPLTGEDGVFFCPAMDLSTMGTGKLLSFQFTGGPTLLFSRSSGSRQLRGGGASDQNPFNQTDRFARTRFIEVIAHSGKPINDAGLVCIVGRHLESDAVADGKADETFTHSARNMCKNEVLIGESNTEHRAGQHGHNCSFQFDGFFCRHTRNKRKQAGSI